MEWGNFACWDNFATIISYQFILVFKYLLVKPDFVMSALDLEVQYGYELTW